MNIKKKIKSNEQILDEIQCKSRLLFARLWRYLYPAKQLPATFSLESHKKDQNKTHYLHTLILNCVEIVLLLQYNIEHPSSLLPLDINEMIGRVYPKIESKKNQKIFNEIVNCILAIEQSIRSTVQQRQD